jgi:hypothetical protein
MPSASAKLQPLDGESTEQFIERLIDQEIQGFDSSRQFYRRGFYYFTLGTAILSAATTVLIGMGKIYPGQTWMSAVALVTSAAITIFAAWDGFFRHKDLWVQKTDTWMSLQNLQSNLQFAKLQAGGSLSAKQVDEFFKRFNTIVMAEHELWKRVRSTQVTAAKAKR